MSKKHLSLLISLVIVGYGLYTTYHAQQVRNHQLSAQSVPPIAPGASVASPAGAAPATPSVGATAAGGNAPAIFGARTKTSGCMTRGPLPDAQCSPGANIVTATKDQICVSGYSSSVRNVTTATKNKVFAEYDIASHTPGQYEIDHIVSLELGGSNDIANLYPEAADPTPGFHEKDVVENYLHSQVCSGALPLAQAQQQIATDWLSVYKTMH